jgi:excisionase family DNA binding protein
MTAALTIPEVCEQTRFSRTTIYEAIAAGELIARKRGARTIILNEELSAWLKSLPVVQPKHFSAASQAA